ncbi:MAG: DUF560 domain-containing protein [Alphaproteobacteria bacterium]|nr:DUF560 domain-containing protein [Alphaproteobacteria bacterium]
MTRFLSMALSALLVCAPMTLGAQAIPDAATLTANQMRALAQDLLRDNRPAAAGDVTAALLARDPADVTALVFGAQAALGTNDPARAIDLASRAYELADDPAPRYVAARLVARGHAEQNNDTRAQFWLRRASQYAPDAASDQSIAEDYAFLRDRNPLSLSLTFGISPTSNVNNGSVNDTSALFGFDVPFDLSPDAQALSGLAYNIGGTATYRTQANARAATYLQLQARHTTYTLSGDAERSLQDGARAARDPETRDRLLAITGSDYAFSTLSFGVIHRRKFTDDLRPTTFDMTVGQNWYGGAAYERFVSAGVRQDFIVSPVDLVTLSFEAEKRIGRDALDETISKSYGISQRHLFGNGDSVSVFGSLRNSTSDNGERNYDSVRTGVNYDRAAPFAGLLLGFGLDYEERSFDKSAIAGGARVDRTTSARVAAQITQIEYYGFQPVLKIEASRTDSDVGLFDRDYVNLGFDIQSSF